MSRLNNSGNYDAQARRPQQPRPQLQTLGERQSSPMAFADRETARVNPLRVQIQDSRGTGFIGNLDDLVERERQRYLGGTPKPEPKVAPVLPQNPNLPHRDRDRRQDNCDRGPL